MIAIIAQIAIAFEPAFVFPGESFKVVTSTPASVSSPGLTLIERGGVWHGRGPNQPVEVTAVVGALDSVSDAGMKVLPVALSQPVAKIGQLQIVPMHGKIYGAIVSGKRYPSIIDFDLAPRSAPLRNRPFAVDYAYFGPDSATLSGTPGGLARAVARIEEGKVSVECVALFDLSGSIDIAGTRVELKLAAGESKRYDVPIPASLP